MTRTINRQCTLCEAHCGIQVEVEGERVLRISGDPDDVLSKGYICPKAAALADLQSDPDRLRRPVKKVGGRFVEIGWDEAFSLAASGLLGVRERHGANAVATYLGNPGAHSSGIFMAVLVRKLLGSRNDYSATSVDQLPQYLSSHEMFGHYAVLPIPDIERTRHLLVIGANPAVSNGSLMTAPAVREKIKTIRSRGGKVVVVDPRRTETARHASEHVAVRPGGDPYLLLGMLNVIFRDGRVRLGHLADRCDGLEDLRALAEQWPPERVSPHAGVEAGEIERLAREFAAAPSAVAYGRVGVCHQQTGSLTHWLINALNLVTGNMDTVGGAMFPKPAVDLVTLSEQLIGKAAWGRYHQRVSGLPELGGELPVAGLADEILTPGEGQVRGMFIYAGNPVLSTPGGARLDEAMGQLEFCVAVDMYVTETTRHADVILPPVAQLERSDVDLVFPSFSVRNQIRYNPAALPKPPGGKDDWEILRELAGHLGTGRSGAAHERRTPPARPAVDAGAVRRPGDAGGTVRAAALIREARHGQGQAFTPRHRPGAVEALPGEPVADEGQAGQARTAGDGARGRPPGGARPGTRCGPQRRVRPDADRAPVVALKQLLDAQQPPPDEGGRPLHRDAPPRRRGGSWPQRRPTGEGGFGGGGDRGAVGAE